jgi:Metallo-peptidase family M12
MAFSVKIFSRLAAALLLAGGSLVQCARDDNSDEQTNLILLLVALYIVDNPPPVAAFVSRANTALDEWQIGLAKNLSATGRTTNSSFQYNPPNWITASGDTCAAKGVPPELLGANCPLKGGVIGVCLTRGFTSTGQILDTTALMLSDFQNSASSAEAQSVFTHEVGHCLGLRHPCEFGGTPNCTGNEATFQPFIMFPNTSGVNTPSASERTALASAYTPAVQSPTTTTVTGGFTIFTETQTGVFLRHFQFPQFFTSASIGSRFSVDGADAELPPGQSAEGVTAILHLLYADGREETRILDAQLRPKYAAYFQSLEP